MRCPNVKRILQFAADPEHPIFTLSDFRTKYGFEPDGANFYYGINDGAVDYLRDNGSAMRPNHRAFFDRVLTELRNSDRPELTVNLSLFPFVADDPFGFVRRNMGVVEKLAAELHRYQDQAADIGKRLGIVIRYASEMNDPATNKQPYGRKPDDFRESFPAVRQAFRAQAPGIRFTFSPGLRADINEEKYATIPDYWPGDDAVDLISCTWYVGTEEVLPEAVEVLRRYLLHRKAKNLPFGIDEIGGADDGRDNDEVLAKMFEALQSFESDGIEFEYVTLFLASKWRTDATLEFLRDRNA